MRGPHKCQQAFEDLKKVMIEEPVLVLPAHTKLFKVHMNASNFAIREVLMQDMHHMAFKNHKLNDAKR